MKDSIAHIDVFLVDDQKITNFINKKLMEITGIGKKTYDFENPYRALEALDVYKPELIFLDLNMPQLNGWEFLEKMENYDCDAQVVIVTSSTSGHDYEQAKKYGRILDYLVKPLTNESLEKLIETYENQNKKKRLLVTKSR